MTTASDNRRRGLALVGSRGSGKTTVGQVVARRLGRQFVDNDQEVERACGQTIAELFATKGEAAFRDLEQQTMARVAELDGPVVATGGGVVLLEANRAALRRLGFVVWLTAHPESLDARLRADPVGVQTRPALTAAGTVEELTEVLISREPLYREVADATVDTSGRTVEQVADAVIAAWTERGQRHGAGP